MFARQLLKAFLNNEQCSISLATFEFDAKCLSLLLSKILGYTSFIGLGKFFTLRNMIAKKTSAGIDPVSIYLELTSSFTNVYYNYLRMNDLSTYGDNISAGIQVYIMILLMWWFKTPNILQILLEHCIPITILIIFFSIMFSLSTEYYYIIISYSIIVKLIYKLPQIISNYHMKNTGVQSIVSSGIAAFATITKLFVVFRETPDDQYLVIGAVLNALFTFILLGQGLWYGDNTRKKQD